MKFSSARKTAAVTVSLGLLLATTACNRGDDAAAAGGTVTLAVSTLNNPFFVELRDGAQSAAEAAGLDLEVLDAQNDSATQTNQLATAATSGTEGVIINPVDSDAAAASVSPLLSAETPIVAVDRTVNGAEIQSLVSSDNKAGGRQAADELAKAMGGEGEIIILQGVAGTSASRDRGAGFAEGLKAYPGIKVAAQQTANFDRAEALNVATNLLQAHSGVTGIFAENDEMALGAIQALGNRAGSDVSVVGFDGTEGGFKAVQDGTMTATIAQQPAELGKRSVEVLAQLLDGETVESSIPVPVTTVTTENVADFVS
ncbi:substrate-binding domain-containing protein [Arthrobacter sp. zg-Y820]|uniref:substrate-binding domain-containing protein n=1 Tax=unclassified Arthrobacter TaxID=235627 RepID=UPI001E52AAE9|nr:MULTISPECIES: substrate-binding domain-containing protein [unclassified Arthrobacter]MCC9195541.1 substrate-binding domain-containing protein [Arthrobacter sp. zg-Y820]MDK1278400.1 substrate-binding domain-containing protein [Arthrobacter sp. zg.Y820]MDK1360089.1 substrate-binding domain-containing protein [Arthrobacter sp. zg-Y1219]WIB10271.1 substrate-binding domain-containing protein [Arthrobacter sp. zg-Y820]